MQDLLRTLLALVPILTYNNRKEFANHRQIAAALDTDIFFAHPYRSCEQGLIKHTNGLRRSAFMSLLPVQLDASAASDLPQPR